MVYLFWTMATQAKLLGIKLLILTKKIGFYMFFSDNIALN
jgi:hypothetical protein